MSDAQNAGHGMFRALSVAYVRERIRGFGHIEGKLLSLALSVISVRNSSEIQNADRELDPYAVTQGTNFTFDPVASMPAGETHFQQLA